MCVWKKTCPHLFLLYHQCSSSVLLGKKRKEKWKKDETAFRSIGTVAPFSSQTITIFMRTPADGNDYFTVPRLPAPLFFSSFVLLVPFTGLILMKSLAENRSGISASSSSSAAAACNFPDAAAWMAMTGGAKGGARRWLVEWWGGGGAKDDGAE